MSASHPNSFTADATNPSTSRAPDSDRETRLAVSIVLPVHNEVGHLNEEIDRIVRTMEAPAYTFEIVVVNDGSTDGSTELLRELQSKGVIELLELPANRGCGNARRMGTRASRGDIVVWTDVDMTYPNDEIPLLVDALKPPFEQVVGARKSEKGTHVWLRAPAKWCIRRLACYLVQTPIPDLNSGFRAFHRETALPYLHMLPRGFSCVTTITMAFLSYGHAITFVPIDYKVRAGESKFHPIKDTYLYILQIIRMVMTFNPMRVFMPLGGGLVLIAFGKIVYDALTRDFFISANAIILTIVSLQFLAIGLLADLICRLAGPRD